MKPIVVKPGDHVASIAFAHRVSVEDIWDHPENRGLRDKGRKPHLLHPGDVVFVPTASAQKHSVKKGESHAFTTRPPRLQTRVRIMRGDAPVANEPYELHGTDAEVVKGESDDKGWVAFDAPVHTRRAWLEFPAKQLHVELALGELDPVETHSGVRMRLHLLGMFHGQLRGELDDTVRAALRAFQRAHKLDDTGEPNADTRDALVSAVGS